ncbi:MAG TPA: hypothetical protein VFE05_19120 [Longimicrobiaceae bacterium]|nr:hypothetical protein [Longimicrobiaceae bacterium]
MPAVVVADRHRLVVLQTQVDEQPLRHALHARVAGIVVRRRGDEEVVGRLRDEPVALRRALHPPRGRPERVGGQVVA